MGLDSTAMQEILPCGKRIVFRVGVLCSLVAAMTLATQVNAADPEKPKPASEATKAANNALLKELSFDNKTSFELAHKGFITPLPPLVRNTIAAPNSSVIGWRT